MKEFSDQVVPNKLSDAVLHAMQLIQTQGVENAYKYMLNYERDALQQNGANSEEYLIVLNDVGTFFEMRGELETAERALKTAVGISPTSQNMIGYRLDSLMKYGQVLTELEKLDEAESVLRINLRERKEHLGIENTEFALGLDALARLLLKKENRTHAEALATQAVQILERMKNPEVFKSLVFRDMCIKAVHGADKKVFKEYSSLHQEAKSNMFHMTLALAKKAKPEIAIPYLRDFRKVLLSIGNVSPFHLLVIGSVIAYHAKKLDDIETRISELEWTAKRPELEKQRQLLADIMIELAIAYGDAGNFKLAEKTFKKVESLAKIVGPPKLFAKLYRNFAKVKSIQGDMKNATKLFQKSLEYSVKSSDDVSLGRTQIAMGVHFLHNREFENTMIMINEGLKKIPKDHPDRLIGYAHNAAAASKSNQCPCVSSGMMIPLATKGILQYLGLKSEQYTVTMQSSSELEITLDYSKIPEQEIASAESIVGYSRTELRKMISKIGQYHLP